MVAVRMLLLGLGVFCLDILNLLLEIRRNLRGRGPSRFPVSFVAYIILLICTGKASIFVTGLPWYLCKVGDGVLFIIGHLLLSYGIPVLHSRLLAKRQRSSNTTRDQRAQPPV